MMPASHRRTRGWRFWDPAVLLPVLLLLLLGSAMVYSATALTEVGGRGLILRHLIAILLGGGLGALLAWLPLRGWEDFSPLFYSLALLLLLLVLVAGDVHGGARRWLSIGPLRLQPSEPAKLALILFLARFLAGRRRDLRRVGPVLGVILILFVPFGLILREPDLGTALAFPVIGGVMLIWAGVPWLTLAMLISPFVTALLSSLQFLGRGAAPALGLLWIPVTALGIMWLRRRQMSWLLVALFMLIQLGVAFETPRLWESLEPYQRARVNTFLYPERDPTGAGYQVIQSKIAIGSGCFSGQGFGRGSQKALSFLPRQHTDFVFSVVGEELGFLGAFLVLLLYSLLMLRGLALAGRVRSRFAGLVAVGVTALIFYHMAVNIGMTLGLVPVTGLPLPLVSYGGSFMVTVLGAVGLLLGVAARRNER